MSYKSSIPPDKMKYVELVAKTVNPVHKFRAGYPVTRVYDLDEEAHHYAIALIAACDMPETGLRVYHRKSVWKCTAADRRDIRESIKTVKCVFLQSRYNPRIKETLERLLTNIKEDMGSPPGVLYIADLTHDSPYIAEVNNNSNVDEPIMATAKKD